MRQESNTLYTFVVGGGASSIAFLLGGLDKLIIALAVFMVVDFFLGVAVGYGNKTVNSKRGFKGLMKKGAMITLVIVSNQLDAIAGGGDVQFLRNAMIMFLIAVEGISITENAAMLGVPVPQFLKDRLEQLKQVSDSKEGDK